MSVVVIPAYQPDEELIKLVQNLSDNDFSILIVDDGSSCACNPIFEAVSPYARVIHSKENEGKGAALKKGFAAVMEHFPNEEHIITSMNYYIYLSMISQKPKNWFNCSLIIS